MAQCVSCKDVADVYLAGTKVSHLRSEGYNWAHVGAGVMVIIAKDILQDTQGGWHLRRDPKCLKP